MNLTVKKGAASVLITDQRKESPEKVLNRKWMKADLIYAPRSEDPGSQVSKDLGWLIMPVLCATLKRGRNLWWSERPVETEYGYHLIPVEDESSLPSTG